MNIFSYFFFINCSLSLVTAVYQVVNKDDFSEQLKNAGGKLVFVNFYATWCGPCKMIAPKIESMSKAILDVVFLKVDVDECEDVASGYNIPQMPTFLYLKNGVKVAESFDANESLLRALIEKYK